MVILLEWLLTTLPFSSLYNLVLTTEHLRESVVVKVGEMCLKKNNISLSYVEWCILHKVDFALSQVLYISEVSLLARSHSSLFHLALLIFDNMRKSFENSKKSSSKEVIKVVGRLKADRFNSSKDART